MNLKYQKAYIEKMISGLGNPLPIKRTIATTNDFGEPIETVSDILPQKIFLCLKEDPRFNLNIEDRGTVGRISSSKRPKFYALAATDIEEGDIIDDTFLVLNVNDCMGLFKQGEVERIERV